MRLLAIDTCLAACQAAVIADGETRALLVEPMARGHQERLAPMAAEAMAAAGLAFDDLDRIAVTVGPGSFTGLRVGMAFAKGLGLALDIPVIGVGTLEALAAGVPGRCAAVIDAGRGAVYRQAFEGGAALGPPVILPLDEADLEALGVLVGPGAGRLAPAGVPSIERPWPDPAAIAALAALADATPPRPLYLRAPDAKAKAK